MALLDAPLAREEKPLRTTILPGALTIFMRKEPRHPAASCAAEKQLGSLNVTFKGLEAGSSYLLNFLNGRPSSSSEPLPRASGGNRLAFGGLPTGQYGGRLVADANGNGRWDTGSFEKRLLPEVIFTQKFEPLKAEWEQEVEFSPGSSGKWRGEGKK